MAIEMETGTIAKAKTLENPNTPQKETELIRKRGRPRLRSEESATGTGQTGQAEYEKCREARIKENKERLQKILDLSRSVKTAFCDTDSNPNLKRKKFLADLERNGSNKKVNIEPRVPTRRSSRLQNAPPVSYKEETQKKNKSGDLLNTDLIEEGKKEEIYTEDHEKLLGSCKNPWTLFVDGYGKDGKRIYDPVKGKTCHQCRQKTMGHRTSCCTCELVQGQFCGDCLYMRYGENVLEAKENPNWTCPVCRGICNCSLCRLKKGYNPTGAMYKKITRLGYKSVAHYLIETFKTPTDSKEDFSVPRETEGNTVCHTETATKDPIQSSISEEGENKENIAGSVASRLRSRKKV